MTTTAWHDKVIGIEAEQEHFLNWLNIFLTINDFQIIIFKVSPWLLLFMFSVISKIGIRYVRKFFYRCVKISANVAFSFDSFAILLTAHICYLKCRFSYKLFRVFKRSLLTVRQQHSTSSYSDKFPQKHSIERKKITDNRKKKHFILLAFKYSSQDIVRQTETNNDMSLFSDSRTRELPREKHVIIV